MSKYLNIKAFNFIYIYTCYIYKTEIEEQVRCTVRHPALKQILQRKTDSLSNKAC